MQAKDNWRVPPNHLTLPVDEVHVWRASMDVSTSDLAVFRSVLSEDEIQRAERFHFQRHCNHSIVSRGLLRTLLGRYLAMDPAALRFSYGRYGKPGLADGYNDGGSLRFNLSHSNERVLYAITYDMDVGIDIEFLHRSVKMEPVICWNCSEREKEDLQTVPTNLRRRAFFNCWTRKEAYVKARGDGLAAHMNNISVSLLPGQPTLLLETEAGEEEATRWLLKEIKPGAGYVACLAIVGHGWQVRKWKLR